MVAASDCRDLLLRSESLIQLGLVPKPRSNMVRVPHVRQAFNWCAAARAPACLTVSPRALTCGFCHELCTALLVFIGVQNAPSSGCYK